MLLVNNGWCHLNHVLIKEQICNGDIELLAVSLRPFNVSREFTVVIVVVVYIPPLANVEVACDVIHTAIVRLQEKYLKRSL